MSAARERKLVLAPEVIDRLVAFIRATEVSDDDQ